MAIGFLLTVHGLFIWYKGQKPLDVEACRKDGGRLVSAADGRQVEYFAWGSTRGDATVAVLIHGQACTGKGFKDFFFPQEVMERLNIRAIAPSLPGHGYTDSIHHRRIASWPRDDLGPILQAEGVKQFMVQGWSYGTAHAMATAAYYDGDTCVALGLNCPYLPKAVCRELGLPTDADMVFTEAGADSLFIAPICSLLHLLWGQVAKATALVKDTQILNKEEPDIGRAMEVDVNRGAVRGVAGQVPEMLNQEINQVWQDPREINAACVAVWYATDDTQCPPSHGKWLAELFEARAGVSTANRCEDSGHGHFSYVRRVYRENGIQTGVLLRLIAESDRQNELGT